VATSGAILVAVVLWADAWVAGRDSYSDLDTVRRGLLVAGLGGLLLDQTVRPVMAGELIQLNSRRVTDVAAAVGLTGLVLLALIVGNVAPVVIASVLVVTVFMFPAARRLAGRRVGEALIADVGQRAAADAMEAERARIARELHDAPLQQLAGVIRRLEIKADAREEAEELQLVADQLRNVLVDLRPPVLDDLGLGAGLEFLVERTSRAGTPISANITDASQSRLGHRPPAEVELAIFRIAQEALGNCTRHARASEIHVAAAISPNSVDLEIEDDGVGIAPGAERGGARRGRLGLASMNRRANDINAELSIRPSDHGTSVRLTWRS
jgi:two-component system NarL family sensor kinase